MSDFLVRNESAYVLAENERRHSVDVLAGSQDDYNLPRGPDAGDGMVSKTVISIEDSKTSTVVTIPGKARAFSIVGSYAGAYVPVVGTPTHGADGQHWHPVWNEYVGVTTLRETVTLPPAPEAYVRTSGRVRDLMRYPAPSVGYPAISGTLLLMDGESCYDIPSWYEKSKLDIGAREGYFFWHTDRLTEPRLVNRAGPANGVVFVVEGVSNSHPQFKYGRGYESNNARIIRRVPYSSRLHDAMTAIRGIPSVVTYDKTGYGVLTDEELASGSAGVGDYVHVIEVVAPNGCKLRWS